MKQGSRHAIKPPAMGRSAIPLILIWLLWAVGILGFQAIVSSRLAMVLPDRVLFWTESAVEKQSPYLQESFLSAQTGWDSEYYLSIAQKGYDDPQIRTIPAQLSTPPALSRPLPLNYAFFPVYPHLMRWLGRSLMLLGLPLNHATPLAGVMISLMGTLAGCFALYDLARLTFGATVAMRSVFYLLIFPTSFFLAQVYTEGLFISLAFGSLTLMRRKQWALASLLATIATLTRAVGVLLVVPLLWEWGQTMKPWQLFGKPSGIDRRQVTQIISTGILLLAPAIAHLIWRFSVWGQAFQLVQTNFFRCEFLALERSCAAWGQAILSLWSNNSQSSGYHAIELILIGLGLTACLSLLRRDPPIALFSASVILISMTCGLTWSLSRYLLTVPALFLVLGTWGENSWFDRLWTVMSVLLLALLTIVFTLGGWAG